MSERSSLAIAADWIEDEPRRGNMFFGGVAALVHVGALLFWLGDDHSDAEQATVIAVWGIGLIPILRLLVRPVPESKRAWWLLLDGILTTALVLAVQDVGNPLVFQRAMMPIALAFMLADRRLLGWWMAGWFGAVTLLAAIALPAVGVWDGQNTGLWVFWAAIPLVLCSGPFMLISDGKREYAELRALRKDRVRLEYAARASHLRELREQTKLRTLGELHSREAGWLEDVTETLAEHAPGITDPEVRRRLAEVGALSEATMWEARRLLDELGGHDD